MKVGVLNPEEADIPLDETDVVGLTQSTMGRMFDYAFVSYINNGEKRDYGSVKAPQDLEFIIENPQKFVEESLD